MHFCCLSILLLMSCLSQPLEQISNGLGFEKKGHRKGLISCESQVVIFPPLLLRILNSCQSPCDRCRSDQSILAASICSTKLKRMTKKATDNPFTPAGSHQYSLRQKTSSGKLKIRCEFSGESCDSKSIAQF